MKIEKPWHDKVWKRIHQFDGVEEKKLWHTTKTDEYYFAVFKNDDDDTWICMTPIEYFETEGCWDQEMMIDHILPDDFEGMLESAWRCDRGVKEVENDLLLRGFKPNKKFTKEIKNAYL